MTCAFSPTRLIPRFSKLTEILTLLCCITLSSSRENQRSAQEVERRISDAVAGEVFAQVKTYQVAIINSSPSHYIIFHSPLVSISPTSQNFPFLRPSSVHPSICSCYHVPSISLHLRLLNIYCYGSSSSC